MKKFADLIICLGVITFFSGGILIALNLISGSNPLLPSLAIAAMLLIMFGAFLKKRRA